MREQGVVVEMHNRDFACFRSDETIHFNLDYLGERASWYFIQMGSFRSGRIIATVGRIMGASIPLRSALPLSLSYRR